MKTKTAFITSVSVLMCGLFVLSACDSQPKYNFTLKALGENVNVHTSAQAEFLKGENYKSAGADGTQELSRPEPVHVSWSATPDKNSNVTVEQYVVELSENLNFDNSITYTATSNELDIYNLCVATEYYWRVKAKFSDGKEIVSEKSTFTTANRAPRNIYVEGVTNIRDLGGWETFDGGRVKQGMIYRCGRLNKSDQPEVEIEITEKGVAEMRNVLKIKSQIDLRIPDNNETGGITSSPLGNGVTYKNFAMEWSVGGKNILTYEKNIPKIKAVFDYLADGNNYPVIYHCNIGTDRTGMFAFLINGLLGVSEDDLYRDYLFSNFGYICYKPGDSPRTYAKLTATNGYVDTIKKYTKGTTLSEKIENYLIDKIGVERQTLEAIKDLLTA